MPCDAQYWLGIADMYGMSRRRGEARKTLICRVSAVWLDEDGVPANASGLLEDRSLSGVGLCLPEPIPLGTKVKIRGRNRELAGTVRHCKSRGVNYRVGIRLDRPDKTWDHFGVGL